MVEGSKIGWRYSLIKKFWFNQSIEFNKNPHKMDKEEIIQALVDAEAEGYYGEAFKILYPGQDFEQVKKMLYFKELVKNNPDVKYDFDSWTETKTRPIHSTAWRLVRSYVAFFEKTEEYALFVEATRRLVEGSKNG